MRILVTGGSGFLGRNIVEQLELTYVNSDMDDLFIADIKKPGYETDASFIYHDIANINQQPSNMINELGPAYDIVFHLAGILGSETLFGHAEFAERVNVIGTIKILELQKDYGLIIQPGLLGDWLNPYMISKRTAERYGLMYRKEYGTNYISIRPTDLYGPGQSTAQKKITPTFICHALENEPIPIYGDGSQMVRMLFVRDAARFFVDCMDKNISVIDLASQQSANYLSVKEYALYIIGLCKSLSKLEYLPMRPGQPVNAKDVYKNINNEPFESTTLQDGLLETIEYYESII